MPNVGSTFLNLRGKHMSASKGFFERSPYLYLDTYSVLPLDVKDAGGFQPGILLTFAIWQTIIFVVWLLEVYHQVKRQVAALIE